MNSIISAADLLGVVKSYVFLGHDLLTISHMQTPLMPLQQWLMKTLWQKEKLLSYLFNNFLSYIINVFVLLFQSHLLYISHTWERVNRVISKCVLVSGSIIISTWFYNYALNFRGIEFLPRCNQSRLLQICSLWERVLSVR